MGGGTLQGGAAEVVRRDAKLERFGDGGADVVALEGHRKGGRTKGYDGEGMNPVAFPFKGNNPFKIVRNLQGVGEGTRGGGGAVGFNEDVRISVIGASLNFERSRGLWRGKVTTGLGVIVEDEQLPIEGFTRTIKGTIGKTLHSGLHFG